MSESSFPKGFMSYSDNIGIKENKFDFTVIHSTTPASAAAVFTKNTFCGCAVHIGREHIKDHSLDTIVVNSGIANVATGDEGYENAREIISLAAKELGTEEKEVLLSSTGVIGIQLPMDKMRAGLKELKNKMGDADFPLCAEAIMTTDKKPKIQSARIGSASLVGIAKGAGMIEPNLATMLVYFFTDARIGKEDLDRILRKAVEVSFNMISIDTDTSTSDTVAIIANGQAGDVDLDEFEKELTSMAINLAKKIVLEGEGTTKIIEVRVSECEDFQMAKKIGKSIINSPLVKTAMYGNDPNWGRIVMAIGKTGIETVDEKKIRISIGDDLVYDCGKKVEYNRERLVEYITKNTTGKIGVKMGLGSESATVWGNDLNEEYIRINAEYTT